MIEYEQRLLRLYLERQKPSTDKMIKIAIEDIYNVLEKLK